MAQNQVATLTAEEIDIIGEIMNISMGSAATAISQMLDKQVVITTPKVTSQLLNAVDYANLEPAMIVKITYVEGLSGTSIMVFRQSDMHLILSQLMGNMGSPASEFVFDEFAMSAACEVMNQMMGSSATALSSFLGKTVNISTPTADIIDSEHTFASAMPINGDENIVSILFNLDINGIMSSEFISVMTYQLAKELVSQFIGSQNPEPVAPAPVQQTRPQQAPQQQAQPQQMMAPPAQRREPAFHQEVNVKKIAVPKFSTNDPTSGDPLGKGNLDLIMNVPLDVSIEIGKTKRKIKDIMDYSKGSVIELEKQAGAPVDIIVNGQLIARGDIVVIDENFAVRITEIVNTKELLNTLD